MRVVKSIRTALVVIVMSVATSACVSVLPDADPAVPRFAINDVEGTESYSAHIAGKTVSSTQSALDAAKPQAGHSNDGGSTTPWSLTIADPVATRGVDTVKIACIEDGQRYEYYDDAEWLDRAPRLFETALVRSFQNSETILSVGTNLSQPVADYILRMDIRRFSAEETSDGLVARVDVYVRLSDFRAKNYAAKRFRRSVDVNEDNGAAVAKALDGAASDVIPEIIEWTIKSGAEAEAKKKP